MPQPAACRRDGAASDAEAAERRSLVREQLDATVSGLAELDYLRQRQEVLVRAALEPEKEAEEPRSREAQLSCEEKLLEENILLLRKQLNCLRRRDAGLITQLEELDRQISDLRLDTEASHDQLETDSRPSSGFYELSDAASGSLSNSSNSVFSECFCVMVEAEGRRPPADELDGCLQCDGLVGGLCDDSSSSGSVHRSLSAPRPPALDPGSFLASCDSQSKYHCDLLAHDGGGVYRYPSPLHAVAVQSPALLQVLAHGGEEGHLRSVKAGAEEVRPESGPPPAPLVAESSRWPAPCSSSSSSSQTPSHKRLDSYIYSLLQRRLPVRTSRPRTSISTDPTKSILRQASLCVRQPSGSSSGLGTLRASELKPSRPAGGASAGPQRTVDSKTDEQEIQNIGGDIMQRSFKMNPDPGSPPGQNGSSPTNKDTNTEANSVKNKRPLRPSTGTKDFREPVSPKETGQPCFPPDAQLLLQSAAPDGSTKPLQAGGSAPQRSAVGSSSQSQDEAGGESLVVDTNDVPAQQHNTGPRRGGSKTTKATKTTTTTKVKTSRASEHVEPWSERRGDKLHHRSSSKKSRLTEDGSIHLRVSKRGGVGAHGTSSSKIKRLPVSIPEGSVLDKHTTSTLSSVRSGVSRHCHHGNHHHHHGRDQVVVVAKPKYKRNDYRRLRAIMEVPYDEAFRRAQRRQRREPMSRSPAAMFVPPDAQPGSPYAYVARSDSEYSAECASLFHSTIVDTSEDERSNYTTNRFGDSESSGEENVEASTTTTSDTEESGGAGGRGWGQLAAGGAEGQEMTLAQAEAFVKIKASHNLKKKILRFRSGSLKLMTTV